jgi:hypothetical protein
MSSSSKPELRIDWATHEAAKYACEHWHYSGCLPSGKIVKVGVWEDKKFIGVVLFARGASPHLFTKYGLTQRDGCELTRIALARHATPVSRIVKIALQFLRKSCPGLKLVVSFADPEEGHHGGVYQAGNWIYTGMSNPTVEYFIRGKWRHTRAVLGGWGPGSESSYELTESTPTRTREGKHRYLMPLDPELGAKLRPLAQAFPKRPKQATPETIGEAAGQNRPGRSK